MNIFSNRFVVEFDEERNAVCIYISGLGHAPIPHIQISRETLSKMSFKEAAAFIGGPIILLTPLLRENFRDYLWDDENPPLLK